MGKRFDSITPELAQWLGQQRLFFVATAPLSADGLVNCSPKGMDSFRIISPTEVAYLDLTGSGIETVAHLKENGRIVIMFCAFAGSPNIVRLHGRGHVVTSQSSDFSALRTLFPAHEGVRSIVRVELVRISDSCGYAVPRYEFIEDRDALIKWSLLKGENGLVKYRAEKNAKSIDGLPGID